MIRVATNVDEVNPELLNKLRLIEDPKPLLRPIAFDVLNLLTERIHERGEAADGSSIGSYSPSYLRFRVANGRGNNPVIRATFTRQLEQSLGVIATENGWGIAVLVSARNPIDNYLNKKNKAKGKSFTKTVPVVKRGKKPSTPLNNNDLISFIQKKTNKEIWAVSQSEQEHAINRFSDLIDETLNS